MPPTPQVWQVCESCGHRLADDAPDPQCPDCGGLLAIEQPAPDTSIGSLRERFDARCCMTSPGAMSSGVWRFGEIVHPGADRPVSYPEGNTRCWSAAGAAVCRMRRPAAQARGDEPDRIVQGPRDDCRRDASVAAGASAVACASTGNTSASLASHAALAGIPALVFVPAGQIALGKLTQTLAYGARTLLVRGDFDACLALVRESSAKLGIYLLNSINPWRIEGQKTIVFELLQQLRWDPPEWIALPAGNLGNTAAFGKALREARAWGLISRTPRILAVQAAGSAPFASSFRGGFVERHRLKATRSRPPSRSAIRHHTSGPLLTIRETNGIVADVSDARS
jgi:threonine synthase